MPGLIQQIGLGVIIGALATMVTSFGVYYKQRRDHRNRLRVALKKEIEGMSEWIDGLDSLLGTEDPKYPETNHFVIQVYRSNTRDIAILSQSEVEQISRFYTNAYRLMRQIDRILEADEPEDAQTQLYALNAGWSELRESKNKALKELEMNL